ncbi:N-acetylneuraminate synthase family protein [Lentisphaera profundi]|uniref:N-acetylneuraminate synthase family protein n=1 Tax=Lentisphaera profundi TaxID=1658616 RepID=A0ABY7VWU8_9BACT|nr:N-acetylneuraminate synthase family protein [Lentisphaera profundi]WDE98197.1 N-acetylneuraminate synthase family protein [Lentisphaera profundi]
MKTTDIFPKHKGNSPYIIAEAGVNHEGSIDLAKRLIEEAKEGGAHAIKFQTYKAETIASKDSPYYWDLNSEPTTSQYELFKKYDSFWKEEYGQLKEHCDKFDIEFMSTAFDAESAIFLNELMNVFKISSSDLTNLPFIELQCSFNKPVLLSTGAAYKWEIMQALESIHKYKNPTCLFHCILNYPTPNKNANLAMIRDLKQTFPNVVPGYSDHTLPGDMSNLVYSALLGAQIIEKHFTHDKTLPGNDHYHAMDKEDLKHFWTKWNEVEELLGHSEITALDVENSARQNARRSLVTSRYIKAGTMITEADLTWKRPASGISPKYISDVIGSRVLKDIPEDSVMKWSMLEGQ